MDNARLGKLSRAAGVRPDATARPAAGVGGAGPGVAYAEDTGGWSWQIRVQPWQWVPWGGFVRGGSAEGFRCRGPERITGRR